MGASRFPWNAILSAGEFLEIRKIGNSAMRNRLLIICVLVLSVTSVAFGTDYAIVVNPANPLRALSLVELGKIFKAKTTVWPDGKGITLVLREPNSPATKFILEKVLGGTFDEEKAVLNDPGRKNAVPVVFAESDEEVMRIVGGNAGAVGVIDVYNITGGVKVIKIDDKQPFDPGYVLKGR
jgi:ABC-type phosphate transport system substrate-binding protein